MRRFGVGQEKNIDCIQAFCITFRTPRRQKVTVKVKIRGTFGGVHRPAMGKWKNTWSMKRNFLRAVTSLAVLFFAVTANAATAVVLSSNGVYGYANLAGFTTAQAIKTATDLCSKKGGVEIRVVATNYSQPHQASNSTIAVSGQGKSAILGIALSRTTVSDANVAALQDCRAKGGTNPHILITFGWNRKGAGTL
jgi:hypothetical protein